MPIGGLAFMRDCNSPHAPGPLLAVHVCMLAIAWMAGQSKHAHDIYDERFGQSIIVG